MDESPILDQPTSRFGQLRKGRILSVFAVLFLVAAAGLTAFTSLPAQWFIPQSRLPLEGLSGSLVSGFEFEGLSLNLSEEETLRLDKGRFELDLWSSLTSGAPHLVSLQLQSLEWTSRIPAEKTATGSAQALPRYQFSVTVPLKIDQLSIASGSLKVGDQAASLTSASISRLSLSKSPSVLRWGEALLETNLGKLEMAAGSLSPDQIEIESFQALLDPKLFPDFLKQELPASGNLKFHQTEGPSGHVNLASGKLQLRMGLQRISIEASELEASELFHLPYPLVIQEGRTQVALFPWDDQTAWSKLLAEELPKAKLRYGKWSLVYDDACDCVRDPELRREFKFSVHPALGELAMQMKLREYPAGSAALSDPELLAQTAWNTSVEQLSEAQKKLLEMQLQRVEILRAPPLPEIKATLLQDLRRVKARTADPTETELFSMIEKSAQTEAPPVVLYFASLLKSDSPDCESTREWLAEVSARAREPDLLGKSFALLGQCEKDSGKQKQLFEMARSYLPKDPMIEAWILRLKIEGKATAASDTEAKTYLKQKNLDPELALVVVEGFLKRSARARSLSSTLFWAREKHRLSGSESDLSLVQRLEEAMKKAPGAKPRKPAGKP